MKWKPLYIALAAGAILMTGVVNGQVDEATRLLDEGNQHFRNGDFDRARFAFEEALSHGVESGAAYYNLGNAYFRLDRLGKAMLNYQRAARIFPGDVALEHNLDLVRSRARDRLSVLPQPVWSKWWNGFVQNVGLGRLFWIGMAAWLAGLGLFGWRLYSESLTTGVRRLVSVLVLLGLLGGAGAVATSVARSDELSAVVTSGRTDVLEAPSNGSRILIVVHEALVVDVLSELDRWAHVRLPNGITGYVEKETIEVI